MSAAFLLRNWRWIAAGGAVLLALFLIWQIADVTRDYGQAQYEAGYQAASLECANAREAAQIARDKQIAEIQAEERAKREALQARLDAQTEANRQLDAKLTKANRDARAARERAANAIDEALRNTGPAQCSVTGSVSDEYAAGLSAYTARHQD